MITAILTVVLLVSVVLIFKLIMEAPLGFGDEEY